MLPVTIFLTFEISSSFEIAGLYNGHKSYCADTNNIAY